MTKSTQIAVYPGSFDPFTNGHLDLVARASKLFGTVIIAIAQNAKKTPFISLETRLNLIVEALELANISNAKVKIFNNLLVDFTNQENSCIVLRGLRAVSDFEYEFQLSGMNKKLNNNIETLFMTPAEQYSNISSSLIREIALLNGNISTLVPNNINQYIISYVKQKN